MRPRPRPFAARQPGTRAGARRRQQERRGNSPPAARQFGEGSCRHPAPVRERRQMRHLRALRDSVISVWQRHCRWHTESTESQSAQSVRHSDDRRCARPRAITSRMPHASASRRTRARRRSALTRASAARRSCRIASVHSRAARRPERAIIHRICAVTAPRMASPMIEKSVCHTLVTSGVSTAGAIRVPDGKGPKTARFRRPQDLLTVVKKFLACNLQHLAQSEPGA